MIDKSEIVSAVQAKRIELIKAYFAAGKKSFGDHMGYNFLVGAEMNALKDETPHGQFQKFRGSYFPEIPERTARLFMGFAAELSKTATVAVLPTVGSGKLLTNGGLSEPQREEILKAVHKVCDGKRVMEMYRALGLVRPKSAPAHHPRKELTTDERLEAEAAQAVARRASLLSELNLMSSDLESKTSFFATRTSPAEAKEILAATRRLNKLLLPLTKRKSKGK